MKRTNHRKRERTFSGQDFGHLASTADKRYEVALGKILLLHPKLDCVDWVRQCNRKEPLFVFAHEKSQYFQLFCVGRTRCWIAFEQPIDFGEGSFVISIRFDNLRHLSTLTISTSSILRVCQPFRFGQVVGRTPLSPVIDTVCPSS